jgi:hypothetical protein
VGQHHKRDHQWQHAQDRQPSQHHLPISDSHSGQNQHHRDGKEHGAHPNPGHIGATGIEIGSAAPFVRRPGPRGVAGSGDETENLLRAASPMVLQLHAMYGDSNMITYKPFLRLHRERLSCLPATRNPGITGSSRG